MWISGSPNALSALPLLGALVLLLRAEPGFKSWRLWAALALHARGSRRQGGERALSGPGGRDGRRGSGRRDRSPRAPGPRGRHPFRRALPRLLRGPLGGARDDRGRGAVADGAGGPRPLPAPGRGLLPPADVPAALARALLSPTGRDAGGPRLGQLRASRARGGRGRGRRLAGLAGRPAPDHPGRDRPPSAPSRFQPQRLHPGAADPRSVPLSASSRPLGPLLRRPRTTAGREKGDAVRGRGGTRGAARGSERSLHPGLDLGAGAVGVGGGLGPELGLQPRRAGARSDGRRQAGGRSRGSRSGRSR